MTPTVRKRAAALQRAPTLGWAHGPAQAQVNR